MPDFQSTAVYNDLPVAIAGDFASANPRASVVAPEGGFKADGTNGVTVGSFVYLMADGVHVSNIQQSGGQVPIGFIHRDQQALITQYLQSASMVIPPNFGVTVMRTGDYYASSTTAAVIGNKAFASEALPATITYGAAGATIAGYQETPFVVTRAAAANNLAVISA